jgi:type IV pilus assembly protein PilM
MSFFKSKRVLAIDIGASELKLAEFRGGRAGLELTNMAVCPLGVEPDHDIDMPLAIVDAIRAVLAEKKIRRAPVALSVTGPSAFLRLIKLPPVKPRRVFQTIAYEAQQNVPFPIDEVVWDYQLMGASRLELDVMLVAIKTEIVQNMTDCVEAAGLEVALVDVVPLALYNAVRYNYSELEGCTLVVDIGARSTNLVFIEEGRLVPRSLPIIGTGNAITQQLMKEFELSFKDAEELKQAHARVAFGGAYEDFSDKVISKVSKTVRSTLIRLHVEVERSINFYRTQHGGNQPARILLAGGTSVIARTDEFFREKLKIDVEYLNPFRNVVVNDSISAEEVGACAHVMGGVVGMGLRYLLPCPVEINLLPPKLAAAKSFAKKQPFLAAAAAGLVLVALCWWFYFATMGQRLQERRQIVEAAVTKLEVVNKQLQSVLAGKKQLNDRLESLQEVVAARTRWLRVLVGVRDCMPDGMWLVSLVPLQSEPVRGQRKTAGFTHLRIRGVIFLDKETDNSVIAFRDRLANAPLFTEKTEIELQPPVAPDSYVREFTILVELKEPLLTALTP